MKNMKLIAVAVLAMGVAACTEVPNGTRGVITHYGKATSVEIEERAKQSVIAAKADAEAMQIKTAALSGNAKLVEYEAVQKWDGKLPDYMMGNGALPFLNLQK